MAGTVETLCTVAREHHSAEELRAVLEGVAVMARADKHVGSAFVCGGMVDAAVSIIKRLHTDPQVQQSAVRATTTLPRSELSFVAGICVGIPHSERRFPGRAAAEHPDALAPYSGPNAVSRCV